MRWDLPDAVHPDADSLARALDLPPLIGRLLAQRGHTTPAAARQFLDGTLAELPDPFLLKDMDVAVARLERALAQRERVCVVSDYDVDGLTSTALLVRGLTRLGAAVVTHAPPPLPGGVPPRLGPPLVPYAPPRVKDGYGFSEEGVVFGKGQGASVLVAVDS